LERGLSQRNQRGKDEENSQADLERKGSSSSTYLLGARRNSPNIKEDRNERQNAKNTSESSTEQEQGIKNYDKKKERNNEERKSTTPYPSIVIL
jgi:hypothetical protein